MIFRSEGLQRGDLDSIAHRRAAPVVCNSEVYDETLSVPQRLFVLGAGEDVKPVVTMASLQGWSVTVADGRAQLARAERFAEAERVLAMASVAELGIGAEDAVVVMTHSYGRALPGGIAGGNGGSTSGCWELCIAAAC